jgi:hypothetical protein
MLINTIDLMHIFKYDAVNSLKVITGHKCGRLYNYATLYKSTKILGYYNIYVPYELILPVIGKHKIPFYANSIEIKYMNGHISLHEYKQHFMLNPYSNTHKVVKANKFYFKHPLYVNIFKLANHQYIDKHIMAYEIIRYGMLNLFPDLLDKLRDHINNDKKLLEKAIKHKHKPFIDKILADTTLGMQDISRIYTKAEVKRVTG